MQSFKTRLCQVRKCVWIQKVSLFTPWTESNNETIVHIGAVNNLNYPKRGTQSQLANFTGVNLIILTQLAAPFLFEMNVHGTQCVSSLTLATRLTKLGFSRVPFLYQWIQGKPSMSVCVSAKSLHTYQLATVSIKSELMLTRAEPPYPPPLHHSPVTSSSAPSSLRRWHRSCSAGPCTRWLQWPRRRLPISVSGRWLF